ncbi:MAG: hypothetical protein J2P50_06750 [Hyphomicrobiaceae bacterium]|nr:hypothetical protein [Hyphomicrobiaceae bacterium]
MLSNALPARVRDSARTPLLERQLGRFADRYRRSVYQLAGRHPFLADLAASFPALLFALAVPRHRFDPEPVIARAIAGAPLGRLCEAAEVAFWLRKLTPEAFVRPLPKLPDSADFRCRVANLLPRSPRAAPAWVGAVADAAEACSERFALWVAREMAGNAKRVKLDRIQQVGLWAWFSGRPGTRGHALIDRPWEPSISPATALDAAHEWQTRVELHLDLGDAPIADVWLRPCRVAGYDFVPLSSAMEILEEAAAMKNCVPKYGCALAHNRLRLWSVRKDGVRVATLEVARPFGEPLPNVVELRAARNRAAGVEVWWAARQWLNAHDLPRIGMEQRPKGAVPFDHATWIALWRPYWLAKGRIPHWLPLSPSPAALRALAGRPGPR